MNAPYYQDEAVTLFCGDCRVIAAWLEADVLVMDPPYGRGWDQGWKASERQRGVPRPHNTITGDEDTSLRDWALATWGDRLGVVFGDLMLAPPTGNKLTMAYRKAANAGMRGVTAGFRRDLEAIYLTGPWPARMGEGRSSVIGTGAREHANRITGRYGHPHAKPVDVMETLIAACPPGMIADPFAGSGSTLVAARNLGRRAIGVELEERYCEMAARRLSQMTLDLEAS